ncbi:MAG: hypothetical protein ACRCXT_15435 [Paraclostridium sp.]
MNLTDIKVKELLVLSIKKVLEMYVVDFVMLLFAIAVVVIAITILIIVLKGY